MKPVVFCKSFSLDLTRFIRLYESIEKYNHDSLEFIGCVPKKDLSIFQEALAQKSITWVTDEEVLHKYAVSYQSVPDGFAPYYLQQLIKLASWMITDAKNILIIDSDSEFLRPFKITDFIAKDGYPYTVMHEGKDLLQFAARKNTRAMADFKKQRTGMLNLFHREGPLYDFLPTPVVWSKEVLIHLFNHELPKLNLSLDKLLTEYPSECLIYGECLLHSKIIPLHPVEPFFKVYHYRDQQEEATTLGETNDHLKENFIGVIRQSYWQKETDFGSRKRTAKIRLERFLKKLRKQLGKIIGR